MKLNLDEDAGAPVTYSDSKIYCPDFVKTLLEINGVKSIFVCHQFITINKDPRADWHDILNKASAQLSGDSEMKPGQSRAATVEMDGQVHMLVQTFRGVPIQIKAVDAHGETRLVLDDRFNEAAQFIQEQTGSDYLKERYWADHGVRYGMREEVAQELKDELEGIFDESKLEAVKNSRSGSDDAPNVDVPTLQEWLRHQDWQRRLCAVQELSRTKDTVELLVSALKDGHPQVRRLAAAALGASGDQSAVEALGDALLNDQSPGVRRTAGDALSDIGDVAAEPAMCKALFDPNKLVRWRAARFLCDIGTAQSLPSLEQASDDAEFEVRMEIQAAKQRIVGGAEGVGPAWKRIIERS